jgi:holliday junction resolvase YEN1
MFGVKTLVRFRRTAGKETKSNDEVDVYPSRHIEEQTGLTQPRMIMFALLVGCDFDKNGLFGCEKDLALQLVKHGRLADIIASLKDPRALPAWRIQLQQALKSLRPGFASSNAASFPSWDVLRACKDPLCSPDSDLQSLECLRDGWYKSFNLGAPQQMQDLYRFLLQHFYSTLKRNWPANYLVPFELCHQMREQSTCLDTSNLIRKTKRKEKPTSTIVIKDPLLVVPGLANAFQMEEISQQLTFEQVEFEMPDFLLEHA